MKKNTEPIGIFDFTGDAKAKHKKKIGDAKSFLKEKFSNQFNFGTDNLSSRGEYREMGWSYNFRPHLKKFLIKQHGSWQEIYAPNKTLARKQFIGKIDKIVELKN